MSEPGAAAAQSDMAGTRNVFHRLDHSKITWLVSTKVMVLISSLTLLT